MSLWLISAVGAVVIIISLTRFGAGLKSIQGAGIAVGLVILLLPWLPAGRYSFPGGSYEKAEQAKVQETIATNEQFNALINRAAALELRIRLLETPSATPAERQAAQSADLEARRNYNRAARNAATARRHLVDRLDVDIDTAHCCEGTADGQRPANASQGPEIDLPPMGRDDHGESCCTAVTEPVELPNR